MSGTGVDATELRAHGREATELLKTLANQARLAVCCLLLDRGRTVGELQEALASEFGLAQSALSQHLAVLRGAGVVSARRTGTHVHYALVDGPGLAVIRTLYAEFCAPGR